MRCPSIRGEWHSKRCRCCTQTHDGKAQSLQRAQADRWPRVHAPKPKAWSTTLERAPAMMDELAERRRSRACDEFHAVPRRLAGSLATESHNQLATQTCTSRARSQGRCGDDRKA